MRFEHWLYTLPLRVRSIVRRRQVDRDLDDEIQYHLERQVEDRVAAGMDRDEARREVLRGFGEVVRAKEQCRDARGVNAIDSILKDLRYAARVLRRNPAFTVVAVLTLALGIGANTAVFSLVDGILLARLPYAAPEELVSITGTYPNGGLAAMREEVRTVDVGAYAEGHWFTLKGDGEPMRAAGTRVSAELFSILGVEPALGRWLRPGEDLAPRDHYVILSHQLWTTRFKRDDTIVGRFIDLDGILREVVAVMPASFQFPSSRTQLWVPLGLDPGNAVRYWAGDFMPVVGRLRAGAAIPQANADIRVFQSRIFDRFPWRMPRDWNQNVGVVPLQEAVVGGVRTRLLILISAVALILISACANVANLSVSRAIARRREIGIRTALGAAPRRIARQLLTESVLLASLGGVVGLLFATQALAVLKVALPADTPRLAEVQLNWRVLLFTAGLSVLTGCAFGLAPVLHALRLRLRTVLDSADRGGGRSVAAPLRAALTIAQNRVRGASRHHRGPARSQPVDPVAPGSGLQSGSGPHGQDLTDGSALRNTRTMLRLLPRIRRRGAGHRRDQRCGARQHAAADRRRGQTIARRRRLHAASIEGRAAVLDTRHHARLFPRDGHSCPIRTAFRPGRPDGRSGGPRDGRDRASILAGSGPDRQARPVHSSTAVAHRRRRRGRRARLRSHQDRSGLD